MNSEVLEKLCRPFQGKCRNCKKYHAILDGIYGFGLCSIDDSEVKHNHTCESFIDSRNGKTQKDFSLESVTSEDEK